MTTDNARRVERLLRTYEGMLDATCQVHREYAGNGCYAPLDFVAFYSHLDAAMRLVDKPRPSFIDVGCGLGTKVLAAGGL